RQQGHLLRAKHDAVLVGVGTVIKDDPSLTCRLPGMKRFSPIRIIIDTALRTPLSSQLVRTSRSYPTWIFTNKIEASSRVKIFKKNGVHVISLANQKTKNKVPLKAVMKKLAQEGITRVLVEGGSKVITSFMRGQLVDHLVLFRSTKIIGSNGLTVAGNLKIERLLNAISFNRTSIRESGEDVVESYER
ncbi:MAG: RibD family protein, partial [Pseudomonadota bacterium]|nr:RibD family protein [Pseudomonadota bacterium]